MGDSLLPQGWAVVKLHGCQWTADATPGVAAPEILFLQGRGPVRQQGQLHSLELTVLRPWSQKQEQARPHLGVALQAGLPVLPARLGVLDHLVEKGGVALGSPRVRGLPAALLSLLPGGLQALAGRRVLLLALPLALPGGLLCHLRAVASVGCEGRWSNTVGSDQAW